MNRRLDNEMKKLAALPYDVHRYADHMHIHVRDIGIVTLKFSESYPFKKPEIIVNEMPYKQFLRSPSQRFDAFLDKICKECCLLCHSYECSARWSASVTIGMIIDDIRRVQRMKQCACHYWLLESIKNKFNVHPEIPIFDYLLQKN